MDMYLLRDRIASLPALDKRFAAVEAGIVSAKEDVALLLSRYERESRDVSRLEDESLSAFLYRLVGKYENKLEKERREEIDARIEYDRAAARLRGLIRDRDGLAERMAQLRRDKESYENGLEQRRREVSFRLAEPGSRLYRELDEDRGGIISQLTEVGEALMAVSRAMDTAGRVAKSLDSAEGWATYDAFTRGGFLTDMAKYSYIDEAEACFNELSNELLALGSELSDVEGVPAFEFLPISPAQRAVDVWFDNIFTDLAVHDQIADNAARIAGLMRGLTAVETALSERRRNLENALAENRRREEELLLSLS